MEVEVSQDYLDELEETLDEFVENKIENSNYSDWTKDYSTYDIISKK